MFNQRHTEILKPRHTGKGLFQTRKSPRRLPKQPNSPVPHFETHGGLHQSTPPQWQYAGFSTKTGRNYHAFRCITPPDEPKVTVRLVPFEIERFAPRSKAGLGGCSRPYCPAEAVLMSAGGNMAYCHACGLAANPQPEEACTITDITPCRRSEHQGEECLVCEEYEDSH